MYVTVIDYCLGEKVTIWSNFINFSRWWQQWHFCHVE